MSLPAGWREDALFLVDCVYLRPHEYELVYELLSSDREPSPGAAARFSGLAAECFADADDYRVLVRPRRPDAG